MNQEVHKKWAAFFKSLNSPMPTTDTVRGRDKVFEFLKPEGIKSLRKTTEFFLRSSENLNLLNWTFEIIF